MRYFKSLLIAGVISAFSVTTAHAACMNKYVFRKDARTTYVTLLTGKLTYQEAVALKNAIEKKEKNPIEWLDASDKVVAKQFREIEVERPMPIGCDGKPSGVVMKVMFVTAVPPSDKLKIRFEKDLVVEFEKQ